MTHVKYVDDRLLEELLEKSRSSNRKRVHHNLHPELSDPVQRFLNIMQPGTYVQPHFHPEDNKWELFSCIRGSAVMALFSEDGILLDRVTLSASGPTYIVEVPPLRWHSITAIEADTVLFEVKEGPYISNTDKNFASWAPAEGDKQCSRFVEWFISGSPGSQAPELTA